MKKLSIIIILFVLATACGGKDKGFKPERLLNEQEMIAVMTDVQILEADINYQKTQERDRDPNDTTPVVPKDYAKMTRSYYDQLFEHYDINDSIFKQNMQYYTERPEVLERIMDSVSQRLIRMKTEPKKGDSQ
jgi:hypothetical protein